MPRIEQPQAFLQIHQPDTGTTFILIRAFREIAIHNSTNYLRPLLMDIQMDERRLIIAHPMLKRILDQGDKQQGAIKVPGEEATIFVFSSTCLGRRIRISST